ncbi:MAG: IS5 family transposase [Acidimicrobiales bacterium]
MTRALDPEVVDAVWAAVEPVLPPLDDTHPLGCHNPRVPDRVCFRGLLIRLVTGSSWVDVEAMMDFVVSDTTLRARRDAWIAAGVFDALNTEAVAAFDRIVGLDLSEVSIDGSTHKAPCGGEGTGKSPVDRGKLGWKWSVATDRNGVPLGWDINGANRNDLKLLGPTLGAVNDAGLIADIETLHLDRGYDYPVIERRLTQLGIDDHVIARRRKRGKPAPPRQTLGMRWVVEGTNSWWSNYGQLRRSTDRRTRHRHAALCLATAVLITGKLIDHRNRWDT